MHCQNTEISRKLAADACIAKAWVMLNGSAADAMRVCDVATLNVSGQSWFHMARSRVARDMLSNMLADRFAEIGRES